jgi:hypothetical protein
MLFSGASAKVSPTQEESSRRRAHKGLPPALNRTPTKPREGAWSSTSNATASGNKSSAAGGSSRSLRNLSPRAIMSKVSKAKVKPRTLLYGLLLAVSLADMMLREFVTDAWCYLALAAAELAASFSKVCLRQFFKQQHCLVRV